MTLDAGWDRLLERARASLERTGGSLSGSVGLTSPSDEERRLIIGITGRYRPEGVGRLKVGLAELDEALRRQHGRGLPETLASVGGPLRDRPAERLREAALRDAAFSSASASALAGSAWYEEWLSSLRDDGTVTRLVRRGDAPLLSQAAGVLELLATRDPADPVPLPVLAERVTGDTKALLAGGALAGLVLRGLACGSGLPSVPRDRQGQRELWESWGAIADDLASQVLVLNLPFSGSSTVSGWLNEAAAAGLPFRLTLQQAGLLDGAPAVSDVFVCENPAVLRVAASVLGVGSAALVCTEGVPSAACHLLLGRAVAAGSRLRWRADFDWAGLRIVGAGITRHGAMPWRMMAADYRSALAEGESTPLAGPVAPSPWSPELAALMAERDRAVMEERLISALLEDLRPGD
jgi:uncharacterized protein (TIGR02679 family)